MNSECIVIIANDPEESADLHDIESILGKNNTCYLRRAMFFDTMDSCLRMPDVDVAVYYSPVKSKEHFEKMLELFSHEEKDKSIESRVKEIKLYPQESETMIENISNAFENIFGKGYKRVIMIGSYCIQLNSSLLYPGFLLLNKKNVVIGPSFSGRYYLFGMSKYVPGIFGGVHWESDDFYVRLGKNLDNAGVSVQELELSYEVYSIEELNQLIGDIGCWRSVGDEKTAYHTEKFLRTLSDHSC